jgi:uncharacterized protein (UPF0276 family)
MEWLCERGLESSIKGDTHAQRSRRWFKNTSSGFFTTEATGLSWLEIYSENYFLPNSLQRKQLNQIAENYDISCHGIRFLWDQWAV